MKITIWDREINTKIRQKERDNERKSERKEKIRGKYKICESDWPQITNPTSQNQPKNMKTKKIQIYATTKKGCAANCIQFNQFHDAENSKCNLIQCK